MKAVKIKRAFCCQCPFYVKAKFECELEGFSMKERPCPKSLIAMLPSDYRKLLAVVRAAKKMAFNDQPVDMQKALAKLEDKQ
jgi:hypothetical protein